MAQKKGLLVMAYGTPYKEEDIEPYYTHIRHGRPPAEEALQDLKDRYEAIGGISPLADTTKRQAEALLQQYNSASEDEYQLYIGLKHIDPFIEEAVKQMSEDGIKEVETVVLTPHYSDFSVGTYNQRAKEECDKYGISIKSVESFYKEQPFLDFWTEAVKSSLSEISEDEHKDTAIIVSAHSLHEKIKEHNDPYPAQIEETAQLLIEQANLQNVFVGWQSEVNTPHTWLGPYVQDQTRDLYEEHGFKHFIYLPLGFVCEHLEFLYDYDYEWKDISDEAGAPYHRPTMSKSA